jgi:hypothetical protein
MWLIWGRKKIEKPLGYAVEFCPICRAPRVFKIFRIGMATHIYYVAIGEGAMTGYSGRCQECNTMIPIDASKFVQFTRETSESIAALTRATYPDFYQHHEGRLERRERVA